MPPRLPLPLDSPIVQGNVHRPLRVFIALRSSLWRNLILLRWCGIVRSQHFLYTRFRNAHPVANIPLLHWLWPSVLAEAVRLERLPGPLLELPLCREALTLNDCRYSPYRRRIPNPMAYTAALRYDISLIICSSSSVIPAVGSYSCGPVGGKKSRAPRQTVACAFFTSQCGI